MSIQQVDTRRYYYNRGIEAEKRHTDAQMERIRVLGPRLTTTITQLAVEMTCTMQAVATGTLANNNTAIRLSLEGRAGQLRKAFTDYEEVCHHIGSQSYIEIEPIIDELEQLIITATGGDFGPIKDYIREEGVEAFRRLMLLANQIETPGKPQGRAPSWIRLVGYADELHEKTGSRWSRIAALIAEEWKDSKELTEREGLALLNRSQPGEYLRKEASKYRSEYKTSQIRFCDAQNA